MSAASPLAGRKRTRQERADARAGLVSARQKRAKARHLRCEAEYKEQERRKEEKEWNEWVLAQKLEREQQTQDLLVDALKTVRWISTSELAEAQRQYASNPKRLWKSQSEKFQCAYDDTKNDSLLWTTSLRLAEMIKSRTPEAYACALEAIRKKKIDLDWVDCYLPVLRLASSDVFEGCSECGHGTIRIGRILDPRLRKKMSILRLWIGTLCDEESAQVLRDFFTEVLLPCGLASRYNEACHCGGERALELSMRIRLHEYQLVLHNIPQKVLVDQSILLSSLPLQACQKAWPKKIQQYYSSQGDGTTIFLNHRFGEMEQSENRFAQSKTLLLNLFPVAKHSSEPGCVNSLDPATLIALYAM